MNAPVARRASHRLRIALGIAGLAVLVASGIAAYMGGRGDTTTSIVVPSTGVGWASVPQPIPDVRFQGAGERQHSLTDFRGKVVLLNIWATWCVPCREEMPALDRLQQKLGGPDFEIVALSIDSGGMAEVRRFYDEIGIRALAPYVDPSMQANATLRVVGLPTTLLLDPQGRERWRKVGPETWDAPEIVEALRTRVHGGAAR